MLTMETMMPRRKEVEPEGRKSRLRTFSVTELRDIASTLSEFSGQLTALADTLDADEMEYLTTDGGEKPARAIDLIERWIGLAQLAFRSARRRR